MNTSLSALPFPDRLVTNWSSSEAWDQIKQQYRLLRSTLEIRFQDGFGLDDLKPIVGTIIKVSKTLSELIPEDLVERKRLFLDVVAAAWEDVSKVIDCPGPDKIIEPLIGRMLITVAEVLWDMAF